MSAEMVRALAETVIEPVVEITAWGDGRYLGAIDVASGSWKVTDEADVEVPGSLELDVPHEPQWAPSHPDHPLRANGNRLRVRVGVGGEMVHWGWYRIESTTPDFPVYRVQGAGLLGELARTDFVSPYQADVRSGRERILFDITLGILPVAIVGLGDEPSGGGVWDRSRIECFWDTVRAWRGRAHVDESGTVVVQPAWDDASPGEPVWGLRDGEGGNLARFEPAESVQPYNAFSVTSTPEGEDAITEVWYLPDGELRWGGRYGWHPGFLSGPHYPYDPWMLRLIGELETRRQLRQHDLWQFEAPFDPRPEVGDVVRIDSARHGVRGLGRIMSLALTRSRLTGKVTLL